MQIEAARKKCFEAGHARGVPLDRRQARERIDAVEPLAGLRSFGALGRGGPGLWAGGVQGASGRQQGGQVAAGASDSEDVPDSAPVGGTNAPLGGAEAGSGLGSCSRSLSPGVLLLS